MRKTTMIAMVMLLAVLVAVPVFADETALAAKTDSTRTLKHQTLCPVMGNPIDSSAYTDIQGQRVYHCCMMCSDKLKADPDKYFKEAAKEGILFENIQKVCPVTGKPIDTTVFTDYEGRRIYFCCNMCPPKFDKDPQKYLSKMKVSDSESESESKPEMKMEHGSMDHGAMHKDDTGGK